MMKLAKSIATVSTTVGLALCFAGGVSAQENPAPAHRPAQMMAAKPAASSAMKPSAAKPAPKMTRSPMAPPPTVAMKLANSPVDAKPTAAKPAPKIVPQAETTGGPEPVPTSPLDAAGVKRDPFVSLVNDKKEVGGPVLPAGKAGLVVATVRVDGTVRSGNELIAVVSNPEKHVYFVRPGDQLYDGSVEKIDLDGVTFHEESKDAFGKPVVRDVTKRIYASAGEQQ